MAETTWQYSAKQLGPRRTARGLATKLGTRYCTDNELVTLMLSQKMCSRVSTFEVKETLVGDLNEWMVITLDDEHASIADVKAGVEQANGFRPAMQELFRYDDSWTGTEASGGSGHSAAQEDAALVEEGFQFEGPCSLMVSVNESYAVVLEGQEEGEAKHAMMGVYERVEGTDINGRGVWQTVGGIGRFLYYFSSKKKWIVTSSRENMAAGYGKSPCLSRVLLPLLIKSPSYGPSQAQAGPMHPTCECGSAALSRSMQQSSAWSRSRSRQCRTHSCCVG
jgi:hypothetical protein